MQIVRILAAYRDGGYSHKDYKLVLMCGIDEQRRIVEGEWMGYAQNEALYYPFILKANESPEFFYGGEDNSSEPTNLSSDPIEVGRFFTVFSPKGEIESWEATYEIVSCHAYVG